MSNPSGDDAAYLPAAKTKDVKPGQIKSVRLRGGHEVAITLVDGHYYAFQAYCLHQQWPLKWAAVEGNTLICGLHAWQFDLDTGEVLNPPVSDCLETYPVRVEDGMIYVCPTPSQAK